MKRSVRWLLAHPEAALFLEPGLCKTSITLRAFQSLQKAGIAKQMLVVAPLSVCQLVWPAEIKKWDQFNKLTISLLHGENKEEAARSKADIHIINYEGLPWLCDLKRYKWPEILVCDEITKLKHDRTNRFRLLRPHLKKFHRRIGLTGMPAPNGLMDLFGQLYVLDLGLRLHPGKTRFKLEFFTQLEDGTWLPKPDAAENIRERIEDICLYMSKADYLELPPLTEVTIPVKLPPAAQRVYTDVETIFYALLDEGVVTAANAGVKGIKLRQIAGGGVYTDGDPKRSGMVHDVKIEALWNRIEEIGEPAVVVYEFEHEAERIESLLHDEDCARLTGTTKNRSAVLRRWGRGELPVLMLQSSQAHGLNLQSGGRHLIRLGPTWNLEHHGQMIDRLYRMGQRRPVIVHTIVAQDTIDEKIVGALAGKAKTQQELLDYLKAGRRRRK
jgi:SNF2 family DNA or RNA helicase